MATFGRVGKLLYNSSHRRSLGWAMSVLCQRVALVVHCILHASAYFLDVSWPCFPVRCSFEKFRVPCHVFIKAFERPAISVEYVLVTCRLKVPDAWYFSLHVWSCFLPTDWTALPFHLGCVVLDHRICVNRVRLSHLFRSLHET